MTIRPSFSPNVCDFLCLLFALHLLACQSSSEANLTDTSILKGWEGNAVHFRMEEGAIVAGNLENAIPNNEFLCTEKSYGDFEMRLEAKLIGQGKNAGIQFRSERIPDHHEVIGFQCDMGWTENRTIWGSLYDESRRRTFLQHPPADSVDQVLKINGWNEFIIRAEGPHIQIWLNGYQTVDYTELTADIAPEGNICLQIHGGPPAEAWYRDIEIREL